MEALKLVVVGPAGAGKTTISNCIADATEIPCDYRPTRGVRILEFEVAGVRAKNKTTKVDVELWDCSGDSKYENCWAAMRKDAAGVIFVVNQQAGGGGATSDENFRQLERAYDCFVNQTKLEAKSCVVFRHETEKTRGLELSKNSLPPNFARISQVSCNVDDGGPKLKADFLAFLGTLTTRRQEKAEREENNIIIDESPFVR